MPYCSSQHISHHILPWIINNNRQMTNFIAPDFILRNTHKYLIITDLETESI